MNSLLPCQRTVGAVLVGNNRVGPRELASDANHGLRQIRRFVEVQAITCATSHKPLSAWIRAHVSDAILVGPDSESAQWVEAVARDSAVPFTILEKTRRGDRDVEITVPDMETWRDRRPVLIDDIISSGRTMEAASKSLLALGFTTPIILGVHGLFSDDAFESSRQPVPRILSPPTPSRTHRAKLTSAIFW